MAALALDAREAAALALDVVEEATALALDAVGEAAALALDAVGAGAALAPDAVGEAAEAVEAAVNLQVALRRPPQLHAPQARQYPTAKLPAL